MPVSYMQLRQRRTEKQSPPKDEVSCIPALPEVPLSSVSPSLPHTDTKHHHKTALDCPSISHQFQDHTRMLQPALKDAAASKRTKPPTPLSRGKCKIKLSSLLSQLPSAFGSRKISVVDKRLTEVDMLPRHFHQTQTLYLSKNYLCSLQGLQQFSALSTLALADNLIDSFDELDNLVHQTHTIKALSLEGNPIARLPNYRAEVISRLPGLQVLDGRAVGPDEPQQAAQALRHQQVVMSLMLSNACLVHKLGMAAQMLQVHQELQQSMCSPWDALFPKRPVGGSLSRLLQLWDYEGSLTVQEHKAICQALRREVSRMHRQTAFKADHGARQRQSWDDAFAQVMLAQQASIAQLLGAYDELRARGGTVSGYSAGAYLAQEQHVDDLQHEHIQGKSQMKREREGLIQELRSTTYSLVEAFKGDYSQHASQYEQRIRQLQAQMHSQPTTVAGPEQSELVSDEDAPDEQQQIERGRPAFRPAHHSRSPSRMTPGNTVDATCRSLDSAAKSPMAAAKSPQSAAQSPRTAAKSPRRTAKSPRAAAGALRKAVVQPQAATRQSAAPVKSPRAACSNPVVGVKIVASSDVVTDISRHAGLNTDASCMQTGHTSKVAPTCQDAASAASFPPTQKRPKDSPSSILRRSRSTVLAGSGSVPEEEQRRVRPKPSCRAASAPVTKTPGAASREAANGIMSLSHVNAGIVNDCSEASASSRQQAWQQNERQQQQAMLSRLCAGSMHRVQQQQQQSMQRADQVAANLTLPDSDALRLTQAHALQQSHKHHNALLAGSDVAVNSHQSQSQKSWASYQQTMQPNSDLLEQSQQSTLHAADAAQQQSIHFELQSQQSMQPQQQYHHVPHDHTLQQQQHVEHQHVKQQQQQHHGHTQQHAQHHAQQRHNMKQRQQHQGHDTEQKQHSQEQHSLPQQQAAWPPPHLHQPSRTVYQQLQPCHTRQHPQQPVAGHEAGADMSVQKLLVTPHKAPRQLSGNPFADSTPSAPSQSQSPRATMTKQQQGAQLQPAASTEPGSRRCAEASDAGSSSPHRDKPVQQRDKHHQPESGKSRTACVEGLKDNATAADQEVCLQQLQGRLGMAQDCSSSMDLELEVLQCQLTQAEAALQSERLKSAELQRQVDVSQGCAMLTQMELETSVSRADRMAGLVCQAEQHRKGQQLASTALRRRMLYAWAQASQRQRHHSLITAAALGLACLQQQRRVWLIWQRHVSLAKGAARCQAAQRGRRLVAGLAAWRQSTVAARSMYVASPEAQSRAVAHSRACQLRHCWCAWRVWLQECAQPKAAAARRTVLQHQLVCKLHAVQVWRVQSALAIRRRMQEDAAVKHIGLRLKSLAWQQWLTFAACSHDSRCKKRQAVVVHKHWVQRRYWYAWRAFLQQCWRARCTLNAAHQHRHMQLQSHSFLKWRQETAEQRWLHAAQQSHRLRLLFRRWQCSVTAQKHSRHLDRQANCLRVRQLRSLLQSTFACWVGHLQVQKHSRQSARHAQHGIHQFKMRQALISWYRCTQTAKIAHLHRQLEASNSLHGHLKQQCGDAEQAVAELQEERAGLHRRLERVADHAKLQVAQLALANTNMQALQQRDLEYEQLHQECHRLQDTLTAMQQQAEQAAHGQQKLQEQLHTGEAAVAAAEGQKQEAQRRCVSLQRHLGKRKAAMQTCFSLLHATGHGHGAVEQADEQQQSQHLPELLTAALQQHEASRRAMQERLLQQQADLHALNAGLGSTQQQQQQQELLDTQRRLQQAECLLKQQRALLDQHSQHSWHSNFPHAAAKLQASEDKYWQPSSQDAEVGPIRAVRPIHADALDDVARFLDAGETCGTESHEHVFPAVQSRDPSGHNSGRSSRASSVVSLGVKRIANRKPQHVTEVSGSPQRSHTQTAETEPCEAELCMRPVQPELDCRWF